MVGCFGVSGPEHAPTTTPFCLDDTPTSINTGLVYVEPHARKTAADLISLRTGRPVWEKDA
jgi:hypothetical protein